MKDLFLIYEHSLVAREKGFDEPCFGRHNPKATFNHDKFHFPIYYKNSDGDLVSAPR
jgi:hypothetical protein